MRELVRMRMLLIFASLKVLWGWLFWLIFVCEFGKQQGGGGD